MKGAERDFLFSCQHVPESGTADKKKAINQVHADLFRLTYHDCHMKARQLLPGLMPGRERRKISERN